MGTLSISTPRRSLLSTDFFSLPHPRGGGSDSRFIFYRSAKEGGRRRTAKWRLAKFNDLNLARFPPSLPFSFLLSPFFFVFLLGRVGKNSKIRLGQEFRRRIVKKLRQRRREGEKLASKSIFICHRRFNVASRKQRTCLNPAGRRYSAIHHRVLRNRGEEREDEGGERDLVARRKKRRAHPGSCGRPCESFPEEKKKGPRHYIT